MSLNNSRFKIFSSPPPLNSYEQNLNRLQTQLLSTALMWAMDEASAAIAHRFNEPLTALLLYLHEIREGEEHAAGSVTVLESRRETVDRAFRETERLRDIMERMGHTFEALAETEAALARGRESIDWLAWQTHAKGSATTPSTHPRSGHDLLTRREREVLDLITGGASNKEGSRQLGISTRTFEVHRAHLMAKFGARNAADLFRATLKESL
jgi:DNA-binding NarL/FixJ family response regulator